MAREQSAWLMAQFSVAAAPLELQRLPLAAQLKPVSAGPVVDVELLAAVDALVEALVDAVVPNRQASSP